MKITKEKIKEKSIYDFFKKQSWEPLPFQKQSWDAFSRGESGIIQVPTGCGKTYAALMGPLLKLSKVDDKKGINILLITPLKALTRDIEKSIIKASKFIDKQITIGIRNGDTSSYEKRKQLINPPNILITTPESLSLLISNKKSLILFQNLFSIIIDEWHELMSSKRGNQCELCLSWLRGIRDDIQIWAMSATIGNIEEAGRAIVGIKKKAPIIIKTNLSKQIEIRSVLPKDIGTFPWSGHLGIKSHESLIKLIDKNKSTLIFTNTRNQSERWYQCIKYYNLEIKDKIAIHHGSLDKEERERVEEGVKLGSIKWVICTSSLDLGVDFQPVEQIIQIGSPKNLARLIQRAGRSDHKPGGKSEIIFMPTNALELLEVSAMRRLLSSNKTEKIHLPEMSFDVLLQHLVSLACGPGFNPIKEKENIKSCWSFRNIKDSEWNWCLDFLEFGGKCLKAYPKFKKLERVASEEINETFKYFVRDNSIVRIHKYNIGTITSEKYVVVKYMKGKTLGNLEENFASKLKKGDTFFFSGKILEFIKSKDMNLYVKRSTRKSSTTPSWIGGQMAISDLLSENLRKEISFFHLCRLPNKFLNKEISSLLPLLKRQNKSSKIPKEDDLLVEIYKTKNAKSIFVFTLEGKFVNEGIAFLWALRFAKLRKATFSITANDFGFSLTTTNEYDFLILKDHFKLFIDIDKLDEDLANALNYTELLKKRFKNIAQISGLVNNHNPNRKRTSNQLQISSNLLFDVFNRYENNHLLIRQAHSEVSNFVLESCRIKSCLKRISKINLIIKETKNPSPFAFPLLVERLSSTLSNESIEKRVEKLINSYEK